MKRVAVIDIGTNSVKVTVADLADAVVIVKEASQVTRLGRNVDVEGKLSAEAIQTTLLAIQSFVATARSLGAVSIVAAGTSALRDASNGGELLSAVKSTCGIDIEIITGNREASLAFKAVVGDPAVVGANPSNVLVFDIGGGSTEMVWGSADGIVRDNVSLNIGAVRLTERHLHTDPPTDAEYAAASRDGAASVEAFLSGKGNPSVVCGVGGTATTLAAIVLSSSDVQAKEVSVTDLDATVTRLRALTLEQRRSVPFLQPERADIIVAGAAILQEILKQANAASYKASLRGMRYGLLLEQRDSQNA
jgi:exopolyphosphatase/guanosine-5'-triphosphate,3'-diphosphate pyrophosphatase